MNRLAGETSPYLLQHADNPVDWYPWGEEALARARDEDRPILLSIGYAACHWCHVMEHESFEDEATAALMNERFVNIKVDREERPDLDAVYMEAVVALAGHGGWPMTVFLTPDGEPFYGGTYYPPEERHGLPSFRQVLTALGDAWRDRRDDITRSAAQLVEAVRHSSSLRPSTEPLTSHVLATAVRGLREQLEPVYGGWGRAPKFPNASALELLLRRGELEPAVKTLDEMARGGMYDLLGGGFHRYSVDERWLVPHFEKMLYDNAQLAATYLHAWLVTGDERYRDVSEATVSYLLRELALPEGGFASAQDADTNGVEGLTFTWTLEEGAPAEFLEPFEHGRSILRGELDPELAERLFEQREQRPKPLRDDKAIASWNGLALAALAEAGWRLERQEWVDAARRLGEFLLGPLSDGPGRQAGCSAATATGARAAPPISTTTRTSRTACSSSTSRPASSAGSRRRTGSAGSPWSSSPTRSTAASSSLRPTPSASSHGRRSSTIIRRLPATRCSRMSSSGWRGSTATTSSSGRRWACSGSFGLRWSGRRRRSAGRSARSTSGSARRGSWRSSGRSTRRSRAQRSPRGSRTPSSRSGLRRVCRCSRARAMSGGSPPYTFASASHARRPSPIPLCSDLARVPRHRRPRCPP